MAVLIASWKSSDMRPLELLRDGGNMGTYVGSFFLPDFHEWRTYLHELLVTIQIAVWGNQPVRRLMDAARAINEMVFAMLFVVAVWLGPFAVVLAVVCDNQGDFVETVFGSG